MADIDILGESPRNIFKRIRQLFRDEIQEAVNAARDLTVETYEEFGAEAQSKGYTGRLANIEVEVEPIAVTISGINYNGYRISVPNRGFGKGYGTSHPNDIFNKLDEGRDPFPTPQPPPEGVAAWPIHAPRDTTMTNIGLDLVDAVVPKDIIYRATIRGGIEARGFTEEIVQRVNDELARQGRPPIRVEVRK